MTLCVNGRVAAIAAPRSLLYDALAGLAPAAMQVPAELEIARALPAAGCSREEAERYTRGLATSHYENFTVASWLLPRRLHQHFYNVYAYCRWADDLGDEVGDPQRALVLLDEWEAGLDACYAGRPQHPVFVALQPTIEAFDIPRQPFADLLRAFRRDQTVRRYRTWAELADYCRYSANPVGRLVLYLCGYRDAERQRLADATCTALQLANFWQDVSRDLEKGRIYIPLGLAADHGLDEDDILARRFDSRYMQLMQELIARTRDLFAAGRPLVARVAPELRVDVDLFLRGGEEVLRAIERSNYNTLEHRPALTRATQARLLGRALVSRLFAPLQSGREPAGAQQPSASLGAGVAPAAAAPPGRTPQVAASYAWCRRLARQAASNFYYAFFLLPRAKREALCALYAFFRRVDDIVDNPGAAVEKARRLAETRVAVDAAARGELGADPVMPALADTLARYRIPPRCLHDLIGGAEMDLAGARYATFEDLREYCYRVAGTVGIACTHVFGYAEPRALELAERLGIAFQLTNILRDLRADLTLARCYLPEEDLARFAVTRAGLARGAVTPALAELLEFEAGRAWRFYEEGAELLPLVSADSRPALWALVRIYSGLLARIEARGFDVVTGARPGLSRAGKLWILARARFGRRENPLEERDRHRRRAGGTLLGRRAG